MNTMRKLAYFFLGVGLLSMLGGISGMCYLWFWKSTMPSQLSGWGDALGGTVGAVGAFSGMFFFVSALLLQSCELHEQAEIQREGVTAAKTGQALNLLTLVRESAVGMDLEVCMRLPGQVEHHLGMLDVAEQETVRSLSSILRHCEGQIEKVDTHRELRLMLGRLIEGAFISDELRQNFAALMNVQHGEMVRIDDALRTARAVKSELDPVLAEHSL